MRNFVFAAIATLSLGIGSAYAAGTEKTNRASIDQTLSATATQNGAGDPVLYGSFALAPTQSVSRAQLNTQYQDSMRVSEQQGSGGNGGNG